MPGKIFLDTNILVYAFDNDEVNKKKKAKELLDSLYDTTESYISTQVIEEFCNVAFRKMDPPLTEDEVREFISTFPMDQVEVINMDIISDALSVKKNHRFSFWDSLIIASAAKAGCTILYSEDMIDGYSIGSLIIRNPFR